MMFLNHRKKSKKDRDTLLGKDVLKTEFPRNYLVIVTYRGYYPSNIYLERLNFLLLNNKN